MKFSYKARSKEGIAQKGIIEASARQAALDVLGKYGFYVTELKEASRVNLLSKNLSFGRVASKKDLVIFTRQFATMLKSAIPPLEALRAMVVQIKSAGFREKILKMAEDLESGSPLSDVFGAHPKIFDPFYVSMIRSGEATGRVAESLDYLADHLEREYAFSQKVKSALLYPAFVVVVFLGAFLVVIFFIVPKLSEILKSFDQEKLPWATKLLIKIADIVAKGGWKFLPLFLLPLIALPIIFKRSKKVKMFYHRASLKIPMLGDFYKKIYLSRFAENLSVLITAGLPITKALNITAGIISNTVYKKVLKEAEQRVSRGEKISAILAVNPKLFPPFVTQMVATGEQTGRLGDILLEMVKFYRQEMERTTEKITVIIEPIMIIILGVGIAILAFAVFVPLFNIGMEGGIGLLRKAAIC